MKRPRPAPAGASRERQARALALALRFRRGAALARREGRAAHADEAEACAARLLAAIAPATTGDARHG